MKQEPLLAVGIISLLLFTTSASAFPAVLQTTSLKNQSTSADFTHTVFAEYGTTTHCGYCPNAAAALWNIYTSQWYPFYYMTFVWDKNIHAKERMQQYNLQGVPDVFFDGGYNVTIGADNESQAREAYNASIRYCGRRSVPDLLANLTVTWQYNARMWVNVTIKNNDTDDYAGHLRVFVGERISPRWKDTFGNIYHCAFLDYAFDNELQIEGRDTWTGSILWDGSEHNDGYGHPFSNISFDNIYVIAAVYNATRHQGYSQPPDTYPFDAYYIDEVTYAAPILDNAPPAAPTLQGAPKGRIGVMYTLTLNTTEPDGENVSYYVDWGDETNSGWVGPSEPGHEITINHSWNQWGRYQIQAKAKDTNNHESGWTIFIVKMPLIFTNHYTSRIMEFLFTLLNSFQNKKDCFLQQINTRFYQGSSS
jgi:hypothetical protein